MCWMRRFVFEAPFHINIKEEMQMRSKIKDTGKKADGIGTVCL